MNDMVSNDNKSGASRKVDSLPPAYSEAPSAYAPSEQTGYLNRPLAERSARIEASSQPSAKNVTDEELVKLTLRWVPPPPLSRPVARLRRPVAVPQVDKDSYITGNTPFLRAYAPSLQAHGISPTDFLAFCDGLTIAQAPSPPIQVVDLIGTGLGLVPDIWAQMTSLGIGIAAGAAAEVTNVARTKLFLKKANAEYFAPRGLKVSVQPDQKLQQLLSLPPSQSPLAPVDTRSGCISITDRRLKSLGYNIAPLSLDVPAPTPPSNLIDRLSAKQVQSRIRKNRERAIKKAEEREKKELKRSGSKSSTSSTPVSAIGPSSQSLGITPITSHAPDSAQLWQTQSYPPNAYPVSPDYPPPSHQPPEHRISSAPQRHQWQEPLSPLPSRQQPTNRVLQRLELKKQSINLAANEQLLEGNHAPGSKKAAKIEKKRAEKLAEAERRFAKEQRREEKRAAKGKATKKDNGENDHDDGRSSDSSSSGSSSDSDSASDREEKVRKALEKDRKKAAKLRWIVVQDLPDEGAFPAVTDTDAV